MGASGRMRPVLEMTPEEAVAEAARRAELQRRGLPFDTPASATRSRIQCEADDERLEKVIEANGDKQLRALGFEVVRFSHPGKTKQTPGIPDRRYYHRARRLAFWWEAKSASGRQRPDQQQFQEMCEASGDVYVLGTDRDLFDWLVARGIAAWTVGDLLIALPFTTTEIP